MVLAVYYMYGVPSSLDQALQLALSLNVRTLAWQAAAAYERLGQQMLEQQLNIQPALQVRHRLAHGAWVAGIKP